MLQSCLSVFLLHTLGLNWHLLSFLAFFSLCIISHSFPMCSDPVDELGGFSLAAKTSVLKGFPDFSRAPWARRLNNELWEPQALLSRLGSESSLPRVLTLTPSFPSHSTFPVPGGNHWHSATARSSVTPRHHGRCGRESSCASFPVTCHLLTS